MKKLFALVTLLLMLGSTFITISSVRATSSVAIEFSQPTYAYKGDTKQIQVKVLNTGTETINNLWLGVDLIHRTTFDDESNWIITASSWVTVYSFGISEPVDKVTVRVMAKIDRGLFSAVGTATMRAYWTPTGGNEVAKGQDVVVGQDENSYAVKQLLVDEPLGSTGTLAVKAFVTSSIDVVGISLDTDWAVVDAARRVEATKTPIKPDGASDFGGFNFDSQQGLTLAPGTARTFVTTYTFSTSTAYAYDYDYGAYYWNIVAWKDGYPGQGGESALMGVQKPFSIPYKFDITVSIGWNVDPADTTDRGPSFIVQLMNGLRKASNFLFKATEGQMCFSHISIYNNKEHWQDATLQIVDTEVANSVSDPGWPHTYNEFQLALPPITSAISMGRKWTANGLLQYNSFDGDNEPAPAYKTLVHEFGHLKLGLKDEYLKYDYDFGLAGIFQWWFVHSDTQCNCIMYHQWDYGMFCTPMTHEEDTFQEQVNHESCWSTIHGLYSWTYIPMAGSSGINAKIGNDITFNLGGRSSGPDNFGYTYLDSNSLTGPTYSWIEISGAGTEVLPSSDDQWVENIGLGFFFNYYGTDYSQLAIGNNGLLFSGAGTWEYINQPITQTPSIHGLIAPYWDDLVTWGSAGSIYYQTMGTAPNRKFVVEWYDNQHYYSSLSGITFEAILYEGTNNIQFQYQDVSFGSVSGAISGDNPPYDNGGSATVGIEDTTGNIGLQYSFNEQAINPSLAILFKFPAFAGTNMQVSINAPASMDHGNTLTYTLYYNDFGDAAASNVVLQATLPSNLDFLSASNSGTYDAATRTVTWNIGTVAAFPTGRGSTTISATIPAAVPVGTVIQTTASISTTTLETRLDDNSASAQTTVTGSNLPPNVSVSPTLGNTGGTPSVYWGTPITFTYHDATATSVDIRIHLNDGGLDITGTMTGGPPDWTFSVTFYPRHGQATVTYTVHGPAPQSINFNIYVDPAGYVYNVNTFERVAGAGVWLQISDGQGGWENAPTGQNPPIMQPDTNPLITGTDGQYQWDVLEGAYRVHVEAPGYYPADSIVITVPPPVTDLHIGLTPLPPPPDNIPPSTTLTIDSPNYTDISGNFYVNSITPFTLTAEDNAGGSGVASTQYRVYNSAFDSGWTISTPPLEFQLINLADGNYSIDYFSTDISTNVEPTNTANVILDNTPPTTVPTIGEPKYISNKPYVTPDTPLTLVATDTSSGVKSTAYRITNSNGYDSGWQVYAQAFNLSSLSDGNYTIAYNSTDNVGNVETTNKMDVVLFSWNFVFKDSDGRGTTLEVNTAYKFFQFIAPAKDFGVRYAPKMVQLCKQVIISCYEDSQMRLTATAVDDKTCLASVYDKQAGKIYWLIEHPPTYKLTVCCKDLNGKAISGASVYLKSCYQGQTDANGKLVIANVLSGTYTVTVKKCGYKDSSGSITVTEDATLALTMTLQTYTLTVCCKDSKGKAISGMSVYVNSNYRGTTDSNGKLVITNITAGTYTVTVKKTGYKDTSVNVTVSSDKTVTIMMK